MARRPAPKHELAFQAWYADVDRSVVNVAKTVGVSSRTLERWMAKYNWRERADALDEEARRKADREAVRRKAEMIQRHLIQARNLTVMGSNWLAAHPQGVTNIRDAMSAIKIGQDMERRAEGVDEPQQPGTSVNVSVNYGLPQSFVDAVKRIYEERKGDDSHSNAGAGISGNNGA